MRTPPIKLKKTGNKLIFSLLLCFSILSLQLYPGSNPIDKNTELYKKAISSGLAQMPLTFRKNMGQWDKEILYRGTSPSWNAAVNFLKTGLSFGFSREIESGKMRDELPQFETMVWNLKFTGANTDVKISEEGYSDSHSNYFFGKDKSDVVINAPDYKIISYSNVYDGIDVHYYSVDKNLKYDFYVNPGADINQIQMQCEGVNNISVNTKGELLIHTKWGILIEQIPESYQIINGKKKQIKIGYKIVDSNCFGFKINSPINKAYPIIIDPINLEWSTFTSNASGSMGGYLYDMCIDNSGNVYATGWFSNGFPATPGVYSATLNGNTDAYIMKLNSTGTNLIFATYIGGSMGETSMGITTDATGNIYITGNTASNNYPTTTGTYNNIFSGVKDVFVTKVNSTGTALIYSTYVGGTGDESGYKIAVNASGDAFVAGIALNGFPTTPGAYDNTFNGGGGDAFCFRLNAAGSALVYSTYIGGVILDKAFYVAINSSDEAHITGVTFSNNFPTTTGAFDVSHNGSSDIFITKLNSSGTALVYSTYLGGSAAEEAYVICLNSAGETFVTGFTSSPNLPVTPGCYDATYNAGTWDSFVAKLNANGSALGYCTYLGGATERETSYGIAVNSSGEAFVTGYTGASDFPVTSCALANTNGAQFDIYVCKFDATGSSLLYSTVIGGEENDYYNPRIAISGPCEDEVYVGFTTHSRLFPTTPGVFQQTKKSASSDDVVIFKLKPEITVNFSDSLISCNTVQFTDLSNGNCIWKNGPWIPSGWLWDFGDGTTSTTQNPTHIFTSPGTYNVKLVFQCPYDSIIIPVTITSAAINTGLSAVTNPTCNGGNNGSATLNPNGGTAPYSYSWSNGSTLQNISTLTAGTHTVVISDANGCAKDTLITIADAAAIAITVSPADSVCFGQNVTLSATANGGNGPYSFLWQPLAHTGDSVKLAATANTTFTITVTDANNCTSSIIANNVINFFENINASFNASSNVVSIANPLVYFTNTSTGATNYFWNFGDVSASNATTINSSFNFPDTGCYAVKLWAYNELGCYDTAQTIVCVEGDFTFYVPNCFTPNGDGHNEIFYPLGTEIDISSFEMYIFDRWGNQIFKSTNINIGWNGNVNGGNEMAQQDVYVWKIKLKDIMGNSYSNVGHVSLIR